MEIEISGGVLHCEILGDGPPVLFAHGYLLSGDLWRATAEPLKNQWRCILPDLRGHGQSPASPDVTITRFADDLVELLDALGERGPVALVGLSMGGIIGFEFFRRHRARLRALGIVCARANGETPESAARWEALIQLVRREGSRAAADAHIERVFAPGVSPALKQDWYQRILNMPPAGVIAAARALAQRMEYRPLLPAIDCPTLVVAGEADGITPVETMREIHAAIPGAKLEIIPNAGHLPPLEQPQRLAGVLRAFLEGLP